MVDKGLAIFDCPAEIAKGMPRLTEQSFEKFHPFLPTPVAQKDHTLWDAVGPAALIRVGFAYSVTLAIQASVCNLSHSPQLVSTY